jgi:hypothetical protein
VTVALIRNLTLSPQQKTVINTTTLIADELKKIGLDGVVGPISYSKWKDPVQGIGAQIILGQDFVDFLASAPELPPTTVATDG